jgi:hypothetical protein
MSHKLTIAEITIGGTGDDNPVPLTIDNYDLSTDERKLTMTQLNVIASTYSVTGLVLVDLGTGQPKVEPNDPVYLPCPPYCR